MSAINLEDRLTAANDPIYEEAMRLGRKWRESQVRNPPRKAPQDAQ